MKRFISLFLLASMLLCISCSENEVQVDTNDTTTESEPETTQDPELPNDTADYNGKEFRIVATEGSKYMYAEEENGNSINDAIYNRDRSTEEKLNCNIVYRFVSTDIKELFPAVQASIMSGSDDYDMIISHNNWELTTYCTENLVLDWNKIPHVDFSKPYWNSSVIDTLSIFGAAPYAVSDICTSYTIFMLWNKELAEDTKVGNLYDLVYDGTWTWDKLAEISANITADINGDSVMDEKDRYGVAVSISNSSWFLRVVPSSCDQ